MGIVGTFLRGWALLSMMSLDERAAKDDESEIALARPVAVHCIAAFFPLLPLACGLCEDSRGLLSPESHPAGVVSPQCRGVSLEMSAKLSDSDFGGIEDAGVNWVALIPFGWYCNVTTYRGLSCATVTGAGRKVMPFCERLQLWHGNATWW